ncbi:MAG: RNB domain-containing ribonuclease [Gemmatimonadota bacterium]|nr:RNB domain-containing ribonuclease [Gemmatimonadota bacterium]
MSNNIDLRAAAHNAMLTNGFEPDFPAAVLQEAERAPDPVTTASANVRDLRALPWSSIDNDTSVDLDQLEVAERLANGNMKVRVAIADVAATVAMGSAIDKHAALNATSVYTGIITFPMLPERLSTQLTSLGEDNDRPVIVIEYDVTPSGETASHNVYLAYARNHAKLAYSNVGDWLDGKGALPVSATSEIEAQIRLQDEAAQLIRADRIKRGALNFETIEAEPVVGADNSINIELVRKTRASHLIEDFMVAANVVMAGFLDEQGAASIRRVVRTPARWNRIVELAAKVGERLPDTPDSPALGAFLQRRQAADPTHFADLSLAVVKLLGPGEYEMHEPGAPEEGHFGLAAHYYTHSTAPNRRYIDLVTQRLLKAVLNKQPAPYSPAELTVIATHCTERENAARKVERLVRKESAAASLSGRVGEIFNAIVTGVTGQGTYARVTTPPVEGRVMRGESGLDVGDRVRLQLISTDESRGFIDFAVAR